MSKIHIHTLKKMSKTHVHNFWWFDKSLTKASSNGFDNFWKKSPELFEALEALLEFEFGPQTIKDFGSVPSTKYYIK